MRVPTTKTEQEQQLRTVLYYGDGYDVLKKGDTYGIRYDDEYDIIRETRADIVINYLIDKLQYVNRKLSNANLKLNRIQIILDTIELED